MDTEPVSLIDVPPPREMPPPPPEPPREAPEASQAPLPEGSGTNTDLSV